jgi:hypothetical protein
MTSWRLRSWSNTSRPEQFEEAVDKILSLRATLTARQPLTSEALFTRLTGTACQTLPVPCAVGGSRIAAHQAPVGTEAVGAPGDQDVEGVIVLDHYPSQTPTHNRLVHESPQGCPTGSF